MDGAVDRDTILRVRRRSGDKSPQYCDICRVKSVMDVTDFNESDSDEAVSIFGALRVLVGMNNGDNGATPQKFMIIGEGYRATYGYTPCDKFQHGDSDICDCVKISECTRFMRTVIASCTFFWKGGHIYCGRSSIGNPQVARPDY